MTNDRPTSIPNGLVVELSRGKVLPGASHEADRWMKMLNDRHDECVATLDRERMAIEIVFRLREHDDDYLYWVSVRGAAGGGLDRYSFASQEALSSACRALASRQGSGSS
jgi:hypothetical protein